MATLIQKDSKIYIAGHRGLVGSAVLKKLKEEGYKNLITKTHQELDLINQKAVQEFFKKEKPEVVIFCAAKVGGMLAQLKQRGNFLYENLMMQSNVIHSAYENGCKRLLFIASFCIYPEFAQLPIKENALFQGDLQYNNEPYGIAKIAGVKMCEFYSLQYGLDYLSIAPISVYGAEDRFDFLSSHVQAAIFRKIYLAKLLNEGKYNELLKDLRHYEHISDINAAKAYLKSYNIDENEVILLGTGKVSREFLHCDDLAQACVYFMENTSFKQCLENENGKMKNSQINIGTGELVSIAELAFLIKEIVDFKGKISFENKAQNDGTIKKLSDFNKAKRLGWSGAKIGLKEGLTQMYEAYVSKFL